MRTIKTTSLVIAAAALCACSHVTPQYGISSSNVEALRNSTFSQQKIAVAPFTTFSPGLDSISCRANGPVKPADGVTYEKYIQEAFVSEFKIAGVYAQDASIRLQGRLDSIDFGSNIGSGKWQIEMTFSSENVAPFKVNTIFPFSTNFIADVACNQVASALPLAVQQLVGQVVSNPSFKQMTASAAK
ncbi:MAG: hypothetical protein AB9M53_04705 [Leptothrix sp. (in: b-proteobacteria)]